MQDQENQPSFGVVWIKFQEVVEILLFAGILFILLNLVVDIATLSKQLALPFWIWILIRAIICIYGFLICVRVLDAYIRHRWKRSDTEKYCISVVFSATAFALAWTQQGWILAFPSLLIGFIPLFCIEVRRQVITKRSSSCFDK